MIGFDLREIITFLPGVVIALSFHEYAHAWMAVRMGDPTPRLRGRLTLDPLAHLDPIGTLLLVFYRFGWAKPVPVNPYNFRRPRQGMIYTSLAGPAANVILAILLAIVWQVIPYRVLLQQPILALILERAILINIILAAFNLIPVPPLDGSKVVAGLLPYHQARWFAQIEPYGPFILMLLVITGLTSTLVMPLVNLILWLVRLVAQAVGFFIPW
ncbi:MAG: site-2 protease family protein [Bacillota bacterium]